VYGKSNEKKIVKLDASSEYSKEAQTGDETWQKNWLANI
jgi:hypothetical protein